MMVTEGDESDHHPRIMVQVDPDLQDLIPGFLRNRQKDLEHIHNAVAMEDFKSIRTLGHRMKGDGGGYGFEMISAIGQALEQAAIQHNIEAIARETHRLADFLNRVHIIYE